MIDILADRLGSAELVAEFLEILPASSSYPFDALLVIDWLIAHGWRRRAV